MEMYHALYPPHLLVSTLISQPQMDGTAHSQFNYSAGFANHFSSSDPLLQLVGMDVQPLRNHRGYQAHRTITPRSVVSFHHSSHLYGHGDHRSPVHHQSLGKGHYWGPGKNNYRNNRGGGGGGGGGSHRDQTQNGGASEANYNSDSGFSSRSPTPNKHQTGSETLPDGSDNQQEASNAEEECDISTQQEGSKGVKRQYDIHQTSIGSNLGGTSYQHSYHRGNLFNHYRSHSPGGSSLSSQGSNGSSYAYHPSTKRRYHNPASNSRYSNMSPAHHPHHNHSYHHNHHHGHLHNHYHPHHSHRALSHRGRRGGHTTLLLPGPGLGPPYLTPPDRFLVRASLVEVTAPPSDLLNGSEWDKLTESIWNKFLENQQTEATFRKKMLLWKDLYLYIRDFYPRYGLYLVGSTMNGFGSDNSDVDMCLLVRRAEMDQRNEAVGHLELIQRHLRKCAFVHQSELIQAKVPILKFRDSFRDLEVDLNCNNSVGIRNTHLLHCYSQIDWRVRPLVLIVKLWAQAQNINDAKNMTISSYSLVLMVIHYLQCGVQPAILPCLSVLYPGKFSPLVDVQKIDLHEQLGPFPTENDQTLGEILLGFLDYYANQFDYTLDAVSVRLGMKVPIEDCRRVRSYKNDPHQWKYLCIEEPFDLTNTARSVYDRSVFERVKEVFQRSWAKLSATRDVESIFDKEKE